LQLKKIGSRRLDGKVNQIIGTLENGLHPVDSGAFLIGRMVGGVVKGFESGVVDSDFDGTLSRAGD